MKRLIFGISFFTVYYYLAKRLTNVIDWNDNDIARHLTGELSPIVHLVPHQPELLQPPPPQPISIMSTTFLEATETDQVLTNDWLPAIPIKGDAVQIAASATPSAVKAKSEAVPVHLPTLAPTPPPLQAP